MTISGSIDTDTIGDEFLNKKPLVINHGNGVTQVIDENGTEQWYRNGELHRDGDLPAIIYATGSKAWYRDGKQHRDGDQPALVGCHGTQMWFRDGKLHRDGDLPAVIFYDGVKEWYKNGERCDGSNATPGFRIRRIVL